MEHPRVLGFLWKHHDFQRLKENHCTLKCKYCDKTKHRPHSSDVVNLGERTVVRPTIHFVDSYQYRDCKVCGKVERRLVRDGVEAGRSYGKWKEAKNGG